MNRKEIRSQTVILPDDECARCPSQEWVLKEGKPSYCARCYHPFPKYIFQHIEEKNSYLTANHLLENRDFELALNAFDQYLKRYPNNPNAKIGFVLAQYKISYDFDAPSNQYIPRNHDINLPPNLDREVLFQEAIQDFQTLHDDEAVHHWQSLSQKINQTIAEFNQMYRQATPCDIFISFKHTRLDESNGQWIETDDVALAETVYQHLISQGYSPEKIFFSKIDNQHYSGDFEAKIYYKLQTAKCLILIGSKEEYVHSPWVKNEWARFFALIKAGKKHPESLILALKNKETILPVLDHRLKTLNILDLDHPQAFDMLTKRLQVIEAAYQQFTPTLKPLTADEVLQSLVQDEDTSLPLFKPTERQPMVITDFEKIEINRIEIEWKNNHKNKVQELCNQLLKKYPNNTTALKYLFLIESNSSSLEVLQTPSWLSDKGDLNTLFALIASYPYAERNPLLKKIMMMIPLALEQKRPLIHSLIAFLLETEHLTDDLTMLAQLKDILLEAAKKHHDFILFDIWSKTHQHKVDDANINHYIQMLQSLRIPISSPGYSIKLIVRILKFKSDFLTQSNLEIIKNSLMFDLVTILQSNEKSTKQVLDILNISMALPDLHFQKQIVLYVVLHAGKMEWWDFQRVILDTFLRPLKPELSSFYILLNETQSASLVHFINRYWKNKVTHDDQTKIDQLVEQTTNLILSSDDQFLGNVMLQLQNTLGLYDLHYKDYSHIQSLSKDFIKFDKNRARFFVPLFDKYNENKLVMSGLIDDLSFKSIFHAKIDTLYLTSNASMDTSSMRNVYDKSFKLVWWPLQLSQINTMNASTAGLLPRIINIPPNNLLLDVLLKDYHEHFSKSFLYFSYSQSFNLLSQTQELTFPYNEIFIDPTLPKNQTLIKKLSLEAIQEWLTFLEYKAKSLMPESLAQLAALYSESFCVDKNLEKAALFYIDAIRLGGAIYAEKPLFNLCIKNPNITSQEAIRNFILAYNPLVFEAQKRFLESLTQQTKKPENDASNSNNALLWMTAINQEKKTLAKEAFAKIIDLKNQGNIEALLFLASTFEKGFTHMPSQPLKSFLLYQEGCNLNNRHACEEAIRLSKQLLKNGELNPKDPKTRQSVIQLLEKAIELGLKQYEKELHLLRK
jgi:TPR repeat protein/outer membrane protein assembly factor BamD (BamD/ComL family)